jgi:hypothetical protein
MNDENTNLLSTQGANLSPPLLTCCLHLFQQEEPVDCQLLAVDVHQTADRHTGDDLPLLFFLWISSETIINDDETYQTNKWT